MKWEPVRKRVIHSHKQQTAYNKHLFISPITFPVAFELCLLLIFRGGEFSQWPWLSLPFRLAWMPFGQLPTHGSAVALVAYISTLSPLINISL